MDNNAEPEFMRKIWGEVDQKMAAEREATVQAVDGYLCNRSRDNGALDWDHVAVAKNLALLHEGLIEWVSMMEEDILILLYLFTIAKGCFVRVDERTGEYDSAMIFLAGEDDVVVIADTADASIVAGAGDMQLMQIDLPHADLIHQEIHRYYDIARSTRQLESVTAHSGEQMMILFTNS